MRQDRLNVAIVIVLVTLGALLRILPHPANFAPITAIAIFGGALLPRHSAISAPLITMMISDLVIGLHSLIPVTWGCYILIAWASHTWLKKRSLVRSAELTIAASTLFFVVTNFAVWLTSGMYAHTLRGLSRCFALAIPFFRNTLISDVLYTTTLFGAYYLATYLGSKSNLVINSGDSL